MKSQVLFLAEKGIVNPSFISLDSTPIAANTSQNNPKSFLSNKFKPNHQPKVDLDCKLVYTLHPIKSTRKNLNSIVATKIMSLWTVFQVCLFMK